MAVVEILDNLPGYSFGTTFSAPWSKGAVSATGTTYVCTDDIGSVVPVQSRDVAYWPDGSVKWSTHSLAASTDVRRTYLVRSTEKSWTDGENVQEGLRVFEKEGTIKIDTGKIVVEFATKGDVLVNHITYGDGRRPTSTDGRLILLCQNGSSDASSAGGQHRNEFRGVVASACVESVGPIRAVVKVTGKHHHVTNVETSREPWLPFILRFYLHHDSEAIKISHTIVFDGDAETDFVCGIGLCFSVPLEGTKHFDRHVRLTSSQGGVFAEAVQGITGLRCDPGHRIRQAQVEGRPTPPLAEWNQDVVSRLRWVPTWNDFSLSQLSPDGYTVQKRTSEGKTWVNIPAGNRAGGLAYLGGVDYGGLAISMQNFWEKYPTGIDIRNAAQDTADLTLWLYSPSAAPMDLRAYHDGLGEDSFEDQLDALRITYEDYEPGLGSHYGIARTTELCLFVFDETPSNQRLADLTDAHQSG
ncbi:hypothetical protein E4T43_06837 [Aureobasidium subglaciale]|nr:hypothetical protein E4T43_06837 [Aureobasidium subglaciale]